MSHCPWPISSPFGPRPGVGDGSHDGADIRTPVGTVLAAPFDGILYRRNDPSHYGWYWKMDHGNGLITRAAHLSQWLAADGRVTEGTPITESGGAPGAPGAGNSTGPHVHFEYEKDGRKLDPMGAPGRLGLLFHPGEDDDVTDADIEKVAQRVVALLSDSNSRLRLDLRARGLEHGTIRTDLSVRAGEHAKLQQDIDKMKAKLGIT